MKGILKSIELKEIKTGSNKSFKKVEFKVDVIYNDMSVKTLKGSYSEDYARKYFEFCKVKTKELIGKEVNVVLSKKAYENAEGEQRIITYIRFMNVLDEQGNPIILTKNNVETLDF